MTTISLKDPISAVEGISALDGGRTFAFHCLFWLWGVYVSMTEKNGFFTWIFIAPGISFWGSEGSREKKIALGRNISMMTSFILLGFSGHPELQVTLFVLFLVIYFRTLAWNLGLIVLIAMESHLHSPTYFFLGNCPSLIFHTPPL